MPIVGAGIVYSEVMSELAPPPLEALERQNRFVSENLRRIFLQIYRIVGNTADASRITRPAPPCARLPRWTRCHSVAKPSSHEYWHMGETPMRLGNSSERSLRGENRRWLIVTSMIFEAIPVRLALRNAIKAAILLFFQHHSAFFIREDRALELSELAGFSGGNLDLLHDVFALVVKHVAFG